MEIPIVMAAFGTTTKARNTYSYIDQLLKKRFPDNEIHWAYSSRMVRDRAGKEQSTDMKSPNRVLSQLKEKGHQWAVVQSLHLTCGHEFYRLVDEVKQSNIRTSIGLPLLCSPEDYDAVVENMGDAFCDLESKAVVLVGHGTDHPAWISYAAMHYFFNERYGSNVYVGVVEGRPSRKDILKSVKQTEVKRVRLIPFMLVAGTHVQEDIMGDTDSWKSSFEQEGIAVSVETKGLGFNPRIVEIFLKHIKDALDIIPVEPQKRVHST